MRAGQQQYQQQEQEDEKEEEEKEEEEKQLQPGLGEKAAQAEGGGWGPWKDKIQWEPGGDHPKTG